MSALFADDECGHRQPEPIRPPNRAERDQATLNAGTHPATGHRLLPIAANETAKVCKGCRWLYHGPSDGYRGPNITRCCVRHDAAGYMQPRRTQLRWPACDLFIAERPAELAGQAAIPGGETS